MPDYSKGKIYRFTAGDLTYYGSTTQPLYARMGVHRDDFKKGKSYASCVVLQQDPKAKIVLVEDFPCENREQLNAREQHFIETYPCVNKNKASIGMPRKEYEAQYFQDNKERIQVRLQVKHTCDCGGCFTTQNRLRHIQTLKHQAYLKTLQPQKNNL